MLVILKPCQRELKDLTEEIRGDLADAIAGLEQGLHLNMPLSRPMPLIGRGVHELRSKDRSGVYRVFYVLRSGTVYLLGAFQKKTEATPMRLFT
jgi:phage-related protein